MLTPINDKILLEIRPVKETTRSGIFIASFKERDQQTSGTIVGIGSKVQSNLAVGDELLICKHAGTKIHFEDKDYLIVREADILATLVKGV